jgi:hypothetical protein
MTSKHQQQNQAAFAAIYKKLEDLSNTRTLYCETSQEYNDMKSNFQQLQIRYEEITCHLADGRQTPGFRISTNAFIFMATANLVNTN